MIKLNNKNITYVALADSSNSIKAPKEIWYADSSNSVKLVYRRKDALIEGEDYEKYHWLVGDNVAYIQGVRYNLWNNHLQMNIGKIQDVDLKPDLKYFYYSQNNNYFIVDTQRYEEIKYRLRIRYRENAGVGHVGDITPYSSMPNSLIIDFYIENGRGYVEHNSETFVGDTTFLQDNWTSINPRIYSLKMSYIREVLPNDTYSSNLIPCKLLKPVPKWLDANGIRRQVGECGMIDLVSGKFYGNVNSVGTFTVENYYERKEWLVGDGSAYINTKVKLHFATDSVYIKGSKNGVATNKARFFGNYSGGENAKSLELMYYTSVQNDTVSKSFVTDGRFGINPSSEFEFHTTPFSSTTSVSIIYDNIDTIFNVNLDDSYLNYEASNDLILLNTNDTRYCMKADVANFKVMRSSTIIRNLIPCTLTMDLPASMDANNIARTKGTSGMWDLVSDRFYSNVANSGTFKAVNLAEGVDYEVHDWLVGDGSAYIDTLVALKDVTAYSIKTQKDEYFMKSLFGANDGESDRLNVTTYSTGDVYWRVVFGTTQTNLVPFSSDAIEIEWNGNDVYVDNVLKTTISYTSISNMTCTLFTCKGVPDYRIFDGKIASLTITSKINFIPVKLLKSIPAKYDANGIARNAGECGMYDTVNDVFYGNVASSGSFSCVNDS